MFMLSCLLGSYFYLQLSQWARDALALKAKTDFNKTASTDEQKKQCVRSHRTQAHYAWPNYLVNTLAILFVLGVCGNALAMLCYVRTNSIYPYVISIIIVFIGLFAILSVVLLATGGRAIANEVARLEEEARL